MPRYSFICSKCWAVAEVTRPMKDSDLPQYCTCGYEMNRDFQADLPMTGGCTEYRRPLVSDSLAVPVHQIEEHKQLFPDVPLTKEGQPVFTNYKQHDDYLNKTGFTKVRKKIKRRLNRKATVK